MARDGAISQSLLRIMIACSIAALFVAHDNATAPFSDGHLAAIAVMVVPKFPIAVVIPIRANLYAKLGKFHSGIRLSGIRLCKPKIQ